MLPGFLNNFKGKFSVLLSAAVMLALLLFLTAWFGVGIKYTYYNQKALRSEPAFREGDIYFNNLTYKEQLLYDIMAAAASEIKEYTPVIPYSYSGDEFDRALEYLLADKPEIFYILPGETEYQTNGSKSRVRLVYIAPYLEVKAMKTELESAVSRISQLYGGTEPYEYEKSVHDYIVRNCSEVPESSANDPLAHTAYGALVKKYAFASGYSAAFKMLMDEGGLPCLLVYGRAYSTDHVWNIVRIGDDFYHVDVMWDDANLSYFPGLVSHAYFNLSDEEILADHAMLRASILPDCNKPSSYYPESDLVIASLGDFARIVTREIEAAVAKGLDSFEIHPLFTDNNDSFRDELLSLIHEYNVENNSPLEDYYRLYRLSEKNNILIVQLFYKR